MNIINKYMFLLARTCAKATHLYNLHPEMRDDNPLLDPLFRKTQVINTVARQLFPNGVDASEQFVSFKQSQENTQQLIEKNIPIIYNACIETPSAKRCRVNILSIADNKWKIYATKTGTSLTDEDILGMAFMIDIFKECYPTIKFEAHLIHLNSKYVRKDDLDLNELFVVENLTNRTRLAQPLVEKYTNIARKAIMADKIPNADIGIHCNKPYECMFKSICWKDIPDNSVFDISRLWEVKKFKLYERGIVKLEDLPREIKLTEKQKIQVNCTVKNRYVIDSAGIKTFLNELEYPIYFMDFETYQPAIPPFKGTSPYNQIPFQFSVHRLTADGEITHEEYLSNGKGDPRLPFLQKLLNELGNEGTVLAYNQKFEISRLKELAITFSEYEPMIMKIINRIKDLMTPFEERYLYHPAQKGSVSLKVVLPTWVPELSYKGLNIGNGVSASEQYEKLTQSAITRKERMQIRHDLLEYCKLDTYAMVKLHEVLQTFTQDDDKPKAA